MANMLAPLTRTVSNAKEMPASDAARLSYRRLKVAGHGMRLANIVEGHHHDGQEEDRRDGPDQVGMRPQHAVLIGHGRPAHRLQRTEVGRDEAQAGDPGRHFSSGHEEVLAGAGKLLQVNADSQHDDEIDGDDAVVQGPDRNQALFRGGEQQGARHVDPQGEISSTAARVSSGIAGEAWLSKAEKVSILFALGLIVKVLGACCRRNCLTPAAVWAK